MVETASQSRNLIQAILDSLPDPVIVISPDFQVRFMNKGAQSFVAKCSIDPEGACCYQLLHNRASPCEEGEDGVPCPVKKAIAGKDTVKAVRKVFNGVYEISATPLMDEEGQVIEVVESFRRNCMNRKSWS
jgi:PAS domain-containing protein